MTSYILILTVVGFAALGMAWMPALTQKFQVSYSIIYVLLGIILYSAFRWLPHANPLRNNSYTMHLSELVVIVSLMGTGLKIDQPFSLKGWKVPFRLVIITMVLCIAAMAFMGRMFFGFDLASALLLAAILAPTDPVLASDVQVGPPLEKQVDNVRFSLTAEAGMNDGMAFPFTWLAILVAFIIDGKELSISWWLLYYVGYKILAGIICGYLLGKILAYLIFDLPAKRNFLVTRDGFVALSATLLVYGITELLAGYGFVAVFVTAVTLRNYEMDDKYHVRLHAFTDQVERILLAIVLILFGGSMVNGILDSLTWKLAAFGLLFLLVIRPLAGMLTLIGTDLHIKEKLAISFFGIRGIGSIFYLAFAISISKHFMEREIWSLLAFIILLSVIFHGISATFIMKKITRQFSKPIEETDFSRD